MDRRCVLLATVLIVTLPGCFNTSETSDNPPAKEEVVEIAPKLAIDLKAVNSTIKEGDIPEFTAALVNRSVQPVTIVLPGDGSSDGMRTPIVRWTPATTVGRSCGNINRLRSEEVLELEPGGRVRIGWLGWPHLAGKGKHQVSVEIEHVPDLEWVGIPLGRHDPEAMSRIRKSAPWKARSNVVELKVN